MHCPRRFHANPRWAETEDRSFVHAPLQPQSAALARPRRYLLKLFRDYVFHTVHDDGSANVDFGARAAHAYCAELAQDTWSTP